MNLEEQTRVWRRLLDLSHAQLAALQAQDVHARARGAAGARDGDARPLAHRGATRDARSSRLRRSSGIDADEVTRDRIAAACDAPIGEALARAAEELRVLVVELDAVVGRNTAMLEQELAIIEVLVQGVTTDTTAKTTYGKHGAQGEAPRLRLLDAQV